MSIYEAYDKAYDAIPYPSAEKIRDEEWAKFQQAPVPTMSMALTQADLKDLIKKREAKHHEEVKVLLMQRRDDYYAATTQVNDNFRKALAKEYLRTSEKSKEQKVWDMAWDKGHANGYADVESYYQDFAELVNP